MALRLPRGATTRVRSYLLRRCRKRLIPLVFFGVFDGWLYPGLDCQVLINLQPKEITNAWIKQ
jgi:hypothetical protein